MPFNPFVEIANEMNKKMERILSPPPAIAIINSKHEIDYIDDSLKNREQYIREFIKTNFSLIEEGQYSLPISGTLLGFFKMSSKLLFVLYMESGKMGNLLLYRGLLENYRNIIDDLYTDIQTMEELKTNANLILKLRKKGGPVGVGAVKAEDAKVAIPAVADAAESDAISDEVPGVFPELLERYRSKKFSFQEGIILQFCKGKLTLEQIVAKSQFSELEVKQIIDSFHKKGWLILHERGGVNYTPLVDEGAVQATEPSEASAASMSQVELLKDVSILHPELLERYRNKKFNFKEGIVLQYCKGELTLKEIVEKCQFPEAEVLEVIDQYQKKGWLNLNPY